VKPPPLPVEFIQVARRGEVAQGGVERPFHRRVLAHGQRVAAVQEKLTNGGEVAGRTTSDVLTDGVGKDECISEIKITTMNLCKPI